MLPSHPYLISGGKTPSSFVINSENSIARTKRNRYFVVGMHRAHADFRFSYAEIRFHSAIYLEFERLTRRTNTRWAASWISNTCCVRTTKGVMVGLNGFTPG